MEKLLEIGWKEVTSEEFCEIFDIMNDYRNSNDTGTVDCYANYLHIGFVIEENDKIRFCFM